MSQENSQRQGLTSREVWKTSGENAPFACKKSASQNLRAACLQNETAPKSFNFKTKNGPKNDPKLPRKMLSLVLLCRISHRHYSKRFHREFPHKIKFLFTTRICRHGHANKIRKSRGPPKAALIREVAPHSNQAQGRAVLAAPDSGLHDPFFPLCPLLAPPFFTPSQASFTVLSLISPSFPQ